MFAIGQVSKMTGLSVRTLRYYDEIGLLKPSDTPRPSPALHGGDVTVLMKIVFRNWASLEKIKEHLEETVGKRFSRRSMSGWKGKRSGSNT